MIVITPLTKEVLIILKKIFFKNLSVCVTTIATMSLMILSGCGNNSSDVATDTTNTENTGTTVTESSVSNDMSSVEDNGNNDGTTEATDIDEGAEETVHYDVPEGQLKITCLDVGKGDCFVIESADSVTMIDTGYEETANKVMYFLDSEGITTIDQMIISHFDKDHVGGANHIIDNYDVGKVYTTYYEAKDSDDIEEYHRSLEAKNMQPVLVSDEIRYSLDGIDFVIYPPMQDEYGENNTSNNSSIVVLMSYNGNSMLFTGDAEKARIKELLEIDDLQADIIKMPHHGSYIKKLDNLLELVNPQYAIITSSFDKPEDEETMDILSEMNIEPYLTKYGDITIYLGNGITIEQ